MQLLPMTGQELDQEDKMEQVNNYLMQDDTILKIKIKKKSATESIYNSNNS